MAGISNFNPRNNLKLQSQTLLKSTLNVGSQDAVNKNTGEAKTSAVFVGKWSGEGNERKVIISGWDTPVAGKDKVIIDCVAYKISKVEKGEYEGEFIITVSEECLIENGDFEPDRGWLPC